VAQEIVNRWVQRQSSVALKVPSAVIPSERNLPLNPVHPDFERIAISARMPFDVDPRAFR